MKKNNKLLISLSISACLAINAIADEKTNIGEITITDTALEAQIKSITSDKLENSQASDIKDILKSMPSVIVDGNARYSQKVYVRGLEDKSSNITIDGARISGQLFHHSGDQTIDAEMLKVGSIELGPNSALSGPGVINGSFTYETKDPSDYLKEDQTFGGKVSLGYQSAYERKSLDVAVFSKVNDKLEFVGIGNVAADGALSIPDSEDIESKESTLKSGLIKAIYKANDANTFEFSYNKYIDGGDRQYAGEKAGSSENVYDPENRIARETFTLNHKYSPNNDMINLETKIYSSSQSLEVDGGDDRESYWTWVKGESDNYADEPTVKFENKSKGIDVRNISFLNTHKLTYGISYDKFSQSSSASELAVYTQGSHIGETMNLSVEGGETKEFGLYFEDELQIDKFLLSLGLRYDKHELAGVYKGTNQQLSPKFKAEYEASDNLKLRVGYGRIFKGPTLGETALLVYGVSENEETPEAQTGNNFELGFDYNLANALNADNAIFGFTAYKYNVDNYMHPTKNTALNIQTDMSIWGVESIFRYGKNDFDLSLSHTYTKGEVTDLDTGDTHDHLTSNIHTFKFDTNYKVNNQFNVNYNAQFVPGNYINSEYASYYTDHEKRSGYAVHNISTTYAPSSFKNVKLYLAIDNLLNKKYAKHTAFGTYYGDSDEGGYEVGRNYKIKLSYTF